MEQKDQCCLAILVSFYFVKNIFFHISILNKLQLERKQKYMGFFSDMNNNEFVDEDLGVVPPIVPSKTVTSEEDVDTPDDDENIQVVKKRNKVKEVVDDDDFSDTEMNEILNEIDDEDMPFDDEPIKVPEKEPEVQKVEPKVPIAVTPTKPSPAKKLVTTSGTVISTDAVIDGNLTLKSSVTVLGEITGFLQAGDVSLETSGKVLGGIEGENVSIEGKVTGDVKGTNVTIGGCKIQGNIYAGNSMTISNKATVVGNVTSGEGDVTILGKIKGDVESAGTVLLKTGAIVKGNITAVEVLIDKGTTFQGSIFKAGEIDDALFDTGE